jgi:elongation factor P
MVDGKKWRSADKRELNHNSSQIVTENFRAQRLSFFARLCYIPEKIWPSSLSKEQTMITTADFKRGLVIQLESAPCLILDYTTQSPSARGGSTLVKTKYRNLLTGQVLEKAFKAGDKVDEADFERRKGQFLYPSGDGGVFMDLENYEQYELDAELFEPVQGFLLEGAEVQLGIFQGRVVSVDAANIVELLVTETAPAIRNATATAQTKEAVLETGLCIQVPGYLESGERIKVDTRDGRFVSRA